MKVILRQDIAGVGCRGDIIAVADGHARNYLLPRGLALVATDGAVQQATSMRRARDLREASDRASLTLLLKHSWLVHLLSRQKLETKAACSVQ